MNEIVQTKDWRVYGATVTYLPGNKSPSDAFSLFNYTPELTPNEAVNSGPTSAATLPNVSSPSCRSEMRLQCAQSKRKRRHVRLAASSLTLASSKERFRRITAICSTRWASMSPMPWFRGGWKRLCQRSSLDVPSANRTGFFISRLRSATGASAFFLLVIVAFTK